MNKKSPMVYNGISKIPKNFTASVVTILRLIEKIF